MKRTLFSVLAIVILAGLTGCVSQNGRRPWDCMGGSCAQAPENGQACDGACGEDPSDPCDPAGKHCCRLCGKLRCKHRGERQEVEAQDPGPATGAITYPYYTVRGPRDFLAKNPPSIGP
jgi:hypothetical protein